jgi:hypothetical protein
MGYRSSVEIVVYGEPEIFDAFIASMKLLDHRVFTDWESWQGHADSSVFSMHDINHHGGVGVTKIMSFKVDGVKWYESYDEIIAWEKDFLPKAVDVGLNWELVRVGEESDDVEHTTGGEETQYLLYTYTNIERNF